MDFVRRTGRFRVGWRSLLSTMPLLSLAAASTRKAGNLLLLSNSAAFPADSGQRARLVLRARDRQLEVHITFRRRAIISQLTARI